MNLKSVGRLNHFVASPDFFDCMQQFGLVVLWHTDDAVFVPFLCA